MSNVKQSSASPSPPPAKRMKNTYAVGPVNSHEEFYLDSESADVHFVFGLADSEASSSTSERVPAHKIILARDSNVFKAMFYGSMKEKGDIRLTDVSEAAFKQFLQVFYLTEVELSVEHLADVMNLGHKYNVTNCIDVCVKFFKDIRNTEHILIGLTLGILYEHSDLMTLCERFIACNSDEVLRSKGFLECDRQLLAHILNANLFVCSEFQLFRACMAWVKVKSGLDVLSKAIVDEYLGELFYNIRFGFMTIEEFCELSKQYNAVLSDDFEAITKLIGLPHDQQEKFNTQSRQIQWNDPSGAVVKCDRVVENSGFGEWTSANRVESIKFTTTKRLLLTKFTINRIGDATQGDYDYYSYEDDDYNYDLDGFEIPVKVKVYKMYGDFNEAKVVLKMNVKVQCHKIAQIFLSKPIFIGTNGHCAYRISIEFPVQFHAEFMYHSKPLKRKVELDFDGAVTFHNDNEIQNNTKMIGIISALEFNRI